MTYVLIDDDRGVRDAVRVLAARKEISLDLETTGLDPIRDSILLAGIDEFVILGRLDLSPLTGLLSNPIQPVHIFNAAFDGMFLQLNPKVLVRRVVDPMLGAMLLRCGLFAPDGTFKLETLLEKCLGVHLDSEWKHSMQLSFVGADPRTFSPTVEQLEYLVSDTGHLARLSRHMAERLAAVGMSDVWRLECAVSQVVAEMQVRGVPLDRAAYEQVVAGWESEQEAIERSLSESLTPGILEVRHRQYLADVAVHQEWSGRHDQVLSSLEIEANQMLDMGDFATKMERLRWVQAQDKAWRADGNPRPEPPRVNAKPILLTSNLQVRNALEEVGLVVPDTKRGTFLREKLTAPENLQPILNDLVSWSPLEKKTSTYGSKLLAGMDDDDRLRCRFQQIINTGRKSSAGWSDKGRLDENGKPRRKGANVQNFPEESRQLVRPKEGRAFFIGDYEQVELRIAAEFALRKNPKSQDALVRAFRDGLDPHSDMAAKLLGISYDEVVAKKDTDRRIKQARFAGKTTNFSAIFGIHDKTLAIRIHDAFLKADPNYDRPLNQQSVREAGQLLEFFNGSNPTTLLCLADWRKEAVEQGYTTTLSGRRRHYDRVPKSNPEWRKLRASIERQAGNQPIQGTSADITKLAEVQIQIELWEAEIDAFLWNSVHDEICGEADEAVAEQGKEILHRNMLSAYDNFIKHVPGAVAAVVTHKWEH